MDLVARLDELAGADPQVQRVGDAEVVGRLQFDLAVGVDRALFLGPELAVAIALDRVVALMADADLLVVLDVLVPVALGVDEDLFLALAVLDAQFVETAAAGVAVGLENAAGLVLRQLVGHPVFAVVEAAGDQRLIRIALQETHQDFHAHPRDGDAAIALARPVGGDAQPATGVVVGLAEAIPEELHLDPAVLVAVDGLAGGAGHDRCLTAQHAWLGMLQRGAEMRAPGSGDETVAIALAEIAPALRDVAVDRLFQYLRLPPFVENLSKQPEIVPFAAGMRGQRQEVSAEQRRFVAFAPGL